MPLIDPQETDSILSLTQNALSQLDLPLLTLISHGHAPPLHPTPTLKFDVRSLPNPPKNIRDAYNGTSGRLQEWMNTHEKYLRWKEDIRKEILVNLKEAMDEEAARAELEEEEAKAADAYLKKVEGKGEIPTNGASLKGIRANNGDDCVSRDVSSEDEEDDDEDGDGNGKGEDGGLEVIVGIYCTIGRHRSVALVEELSRMEWPGWRVRVMHRDVAKKRGEGKNSKGDGDRKKGRGTRGGGMLTEDVDTRDFA